MFNMQYKYAINYLMFSYIGRKEIYYLFTHWPYNALPLNRYWLLR